MKPERLTFAEICRRADEFRKTHTISTEEIPVDIETIVEVRLKMNIIPVKNLCQVPHVEGILTKDLTGIYVDEGRFEENSPRLRFTLAHEIGHLVLHRPFYENMEYKNHEDFIYFLQNLPDEDLEWFERQANEFAGRLLVPVEFLERFVKVENAKVKIQREKFSDYDDIDTYLIDFASRNIASHFDVSREVISTRLKKERLLDDLLR